MIAQAEGNPWIIVVFVYFPSVKQGLGSCSYYTPEPLKLSETTQSSQILGLATSPLSAFNYDVSSHPPAVNDSAVYGKNLETVIIEARENFRFHFLRIR